MGRFVPYPIADEDEARSTISTSGYHGAILADCIVDFKKVPKAKPSKPKPPASRPIDTYTLLDLLENLKRITTECERAIKRSTPDLFPVDTVDESLIGQNVLIWIKKVSNPYKVRVKEIKKGSITGIIGEFIYLDAKHTSELTGFFKLSEITRIFVLK